MNLGIDLGTTNSRIARTTWAGASALVADGRDSSRLTTPSVIYVDADGALVGQPVEDLCEDQPALPAIRDLKAAWGSSDSIADATGQAWSVTELVACLLKKLKRDVEVSSQESIERVTIAVPRSASVAARQCVSQAGSLAGFSRMALVEEPLAVACHYGLATHASPLTLLVFDWGGGGFRATVLRRDAGRLAVLSEQGESRWSGRALDDQLAGLIAEQFRDEQAFDPLADAAAQVTLRRQVEALKINLLSRPCGSERLNFFLGGRVLEFVLLDSDVQQLLKPALEAAWQTCEQALQSAELTWQSLDRIALSGELSALPMLKQNWRSRLPRPHEQFLRHQPGLAVACGAALWEGDPPWRTAESRSSLTHGSAVHRGGLPSHVADTDLGFHALDVATGALRLDPVIACGTPLTARGQRTFYVNRPDQTQMVLELLQGRSGDLPATSLGHCVVPLQQPRTNPAVEVQVDWNANGSITVVARDAENGQPTGWTFEPLTTLEPAIDEAQQRRLQRTPLRD